MLKEALLLFAVMSFLGCYQIHSDDDLRTVPSTNNPNLLPANLRDQSPVGPFMSSASSGDREYEKKGHEYW